MMDPEAEGGYFMTCKHEDLDCLGSIQQAYGLLAFRAVVLFRMSILSLSFKSMAVAGIVAAAIIRPLKQARKLI